MGLTDAVLPHNVKSVLILPSAQSYIARKGSEGKENLPEVIRFPAMGAVGWLEAAVCLWIKIINFEVKGDFNIRLLGQLTYYLFWRYPSKHFQGIYVLSVYPPQETLLVEQTEELVCRCWGESFRKYFPRWRFTNPINLFWKITKVTWSARRRVLGPGERTNIENTLIPTLFLNFDMNNK